MLNKAVTDMVSAGLGASMAVTFTNPLDVAKTRLQMTNELIASSKQTKNIIRYKGPFDCLKVTYQIEGMKGVQRGLNVAMVREFSKCCVRIGMFDPLMRVIHPDKNTPAPMYKRFIGGGICGVLSAVLFNPLDIAKTRVQAAGATLSVSHHEISNNQSVREVLRGVMKSGDGLKSLWYGTTANAIRGVTFTSVLLAVNSKMKERIKSSTEMKDGVLLDTLCPLIGSALGIVVMNPVDVIRTRLYNQPTNARLYSGPMNAAYKIGKIEGIAAFWKGGLSHYLRVGPHTILTFIFMGRIRDLFAELDRNMISH